MAGRGPAPKPDAERRRRNAPPVATSTVTPDNELRGPALPDTVSWPEPTLRWWQTWRESPQAQTFTATDWDFLLDTALLHADYWNGARGVAGELRLRVAKYGATPEDRARLRMQITDESSAPDGAPSTPAAPAKDAAARRARLLKVVDGDEATG